MRFVSLLPKPQNLTQNWAKLLTILGLAGFLLGGVGLVAGELGLAGMAWSTACVTFALRLRTTRKWQPFAFSCWVLAFVSVAMFFPAVFQSYWTIDAGALWFGSETTGSETAGSETAGSEAIGGKSIATGASEDGVPGGASIWVRQDATKAVAPLIQVIMFGMGTTLGLADFLRVLSRPKAIIVGMFLQFGIMPFLGFALAMVFRLPPEIAAGVVLIGACPGGVASNLIAYLARGDVALSVTMTACSTLLSPLMTPLMMWLLAGAFIDVEFNSMLWSILKLIIVPTAGGLIVNALLQRNGWRGAWVDRLLSSLAMLAICLVIGIIVAQSRDQLLVVGLLLILVAVLHNALGYVLGYWGARILGLEESACRTVAIEVGMQNGGMATALATTVLKAPQAALAGAIFGPWMSISGSLLASWWGRKPVEVHTPIEIETA
jgi:BASS family bile acid:Na+ symporter